MSRDGRRSLKITLNALKRIGYILAIGHPLRASYGTRSPLSRNPEQTPVMDHKAIQGLAALIWMLECIGSAQEDENDQSIAKILTANEMQLRALVKAVTQRLATEN